MPEELGGRDLRALSPAGALFLLCPGSPRCYCCCFCSWRILFTAFGLTVFLSVLGLIALVAILRPLCNHVRVSAQTLCDFIEGK